MIRRILLFFLCIVSIFVSCENDSDSDENTVGIMQNYEEDADVEYETNTQEIKDAQQLSDDRLEDNSADVSANVTLPLEENINDPIFYEGDIMEYIDSLTDDMLDAYDEFPSYESYWNDPIVFLNKINDDLRLYGIHTEGKTAMLLYVQGEKVFVQYGFQNHYAWEPELNYSDIDSDGVKEIIISDIVVTGNVMRYELIVCDYEDTWNVYRYDDYLQDIEETIQWRFDEEINTIIFMDKEGNVLTEQALPEWTSSHPFAGGINYEDWMSFDANTMLFCVTPLIGLESSLPYSPIEIVFNVVYKDGEFELGDYYIRDDIRDTY